MSVSSHINYSLVTSRKESFVCRLSEIKLQAARLWDTSDRLPSLRSFTHTVSSRYSIPTERSYDNPAQLILLSAVQKLIWRSHMTFASNIGLFISPSGTSELDCATTKTDTTERSVSIGRESLKVFFLVLGALAYL